MWKGGGEQYNAGVPAHAVVHARSCFCGITAVLRPSFLLLSKQVKDSGMMKYQDVYLFFFVSAAHTSVLLPSFPLLPNDPGMMMYQEYQ